MISLTLDHAIELIRIGQRTEAQVALEAILQSDPRNVPAWFWYCETQASVLEKIRALELCLQYNPGNAQALRALDKFRGQLPQVPPARGPQPVRKPAPPPARRGAWVLVLVLALLMLLGAGAGLVWAFGQPQPVTVITGRLPVSNATAVATAAIASTLAPIATNAPVQPTATPVAATTTPTPNPIGEIKVDGLRYELWGVHLETADMGNLVVLDGAVLNPGLQPANFYGAWILLRDIDDRAIPYDQDESTAATARYAADTPRAIGP